MHHPLHGMVSKNLLKLKKKNKKTYHSINIGPLVSIMQFGLKYQIGHQSYKLPCTGPTAHMGSWVGAGLLVTLMS